MPEAYPYPLSEYFDKVDDNRLLEVWDIIRRGRTQDEPLFGIYWQLKQSGLWPLEKYNFDILTGLEEMSRR